MNQLSHATDEVLLVGDTIHDWEVAQEMGVACCLVAHGHQAKTRLQQLGVPVVEALSDILPLLSPYHPRYFSRTRYHSQAWVRWGAQHLDPCQA